MPLKKMPMTHRDDYRSDKKGRFDRPARPSKPRRENDATERPRRPAGEKSGFTPNKSRRFPPRRDEEQNEKRPFPPRRFPPRRDEEQTERPRRFRAPEPEKRGEVTLRPRKSKQVAEHKPHTKVRVSPESTKTEIRLNKFIANSGICSRREADEYISAGLVTVNGEVVTQMGSKIKPTDDIRFNGERLQGEEKVYILMNKPKDFVTTTDDPNAEQTVMDIIAGKCAQRVYPVGRLDKTTTGVLLLTNDGALTEQLTHPSYNRKKIYQVDLHKNLKKTDLETLISGVELEDGPAHVDEISYIDENESKVGVEIHSGRNRIIRRMFEHLGYSVKRLDRVYFAGLTKKNLRRGAWRYLTPKEVAMLKMGAYE